MSKKPAKGELIAIADDVLCSLDGTGTSPHEMAQQLAKEPAAKRRDLFEALRDRAKARRLQRSASSVVALFSPLASPGASNKPEFLPKYVKSVFDCAVTLCGQHALAATSSLFLSLITAFETEAERTKGSAGFHVDTLASVDSLVSAFDAVLADRTRKSELVRTRSQWLPLVPEIACRQMIPLSHEGAAALVVLLEECAPELPAAVRLSIAPLIRMSGVEQRVPGQTAPAEIVGASLPSAVPAKAYSKLPEVERFADALHAILHQLSNDFEARLSNQAALIQRLESDGAESVLLLDREAMKAASLREEVAVLGERMGAMQIQLEGATKQSAIVQSELERYRTTHSIVLSDAETREKDAVARTKRELVEKQLVTLTSIRDCIAELSTTHSHERAVRQVVTNFNNFARFLAHSKYTTPEEIARIDNATGSGGGDAS